MAPNALPFVNLFSNRHKNIGHQFHLKNCGGVGSTLFQRRLQSIKDRFVAVNAGFLQENRRLVDAVGCFSSPPPSDAENERMAAARSLAAARLESVRRALVKRSVREKLDEWQQKKDEMSRVAAAAKTSPPREHVPVVREDFGLTLREIQKRAGLVSLDHRRRALEICFRGTVAKAVLTASAVNERLGRDPRLASELGERIDEYRRLESRLDALKNVGAVADETPLTAAKRLSEELALYQNNVVIPTQARLDAQAAVRRGPMNKFSVNVPGDHVVKHVRRQYVALVKNNKMLMNNLDAVKRVPFADDPTTLLFRRNVVKVVHTLVNTISCASAAHMADKLDRLDALLAGRPVCAANVRVMAGRNEEALAFCMETLSAKVVCYAEEVVSVNARAAYEVAAVVTRLWSGHQRFGKVLFAELKHKCPLLIPFCYPVAKSLCEQRLDHESFGYKIDSSGNVESDAKYLKRMTGIVRFYAALMVASSKYDLPIIGLSQAWIFVAGTLNQNPVADITATILAEFLNVVGFTMHQAYGKQFIKLLQYIDTYYLKKIVLVTPAGHGGPVTRLNSFVSKCLHSRSFEEPKSVLSPDFW